MTQPPEWCQKNVKRMMGMMLRDQRMGRPKPLGIKMSKEALDFFKSFLKSEAYHFNPLDMKFLGVPVALDSRLPPFTLTVLRLSDSAKKLLLPK